VLPPTPKKMRLGAAGGAGGERGHGGAPLQALLSVCEKLLDLLAIPRCRSPAELEHPAGHSGGTHVLFHSHEPTRLGAAWESGWWESGPLVAAGREAEEGTNRYLYDAPRPAQARDRNKERGYERERERDADMPRGGIGTNMTGVGAETETQSSSRDELSACCGDRVLEMRKSASRRGSGSGIGKAGE
jgi:hypothetical protein